MSKTILIFALTLVVFQNASASKILGVFQIPVRSHHILASTLLKALADRGHEVTLLSPFPAFEKNYSNYKEIEITGISQIAEDPKFRKLFTGGQVWSNLKGLTLMHNLLHKFNECFLNHTTVRQLTSGKETFDVVIQMYHANDAYFGLAHRLGASTIAFSTVGSYEATNDLTKNSSPLSFVPSMFLQYTNSMNFYQRVNNVLANIAWQLYAKFINEHNQNLLLQKYFPDSPDIHALRNNVSLVMLNSHFTFEGPAPFLPNIIHIGGFHVKPPQDLTGELKEFMDSSNEGVVLFSLGSNVRSSELSDEKIQSILRTFASLPQKVLWKFEEPAKIKSVPHNVKVLKWLPQSDILAHKNLRGFVTHGGLLSTTEAIYHGVPVVGIPVYGDQITNVHKAVTQGYAVEVDRDSLSYDTLHRAINEVIGDHRYKLAAMRMSEVFKDQQVSPLEKAIYWVEYVVKHKGAHHLKSAATNLNWFQLNSLDVFSFLLSTLVLILLGLYKTIRFVCGKLCKVHVTSKIKRN